MTRPEKSAMSKNIDPEKIIREIKRKTRRKFSAEEKIRIVLEGLSRYIHVDIGCPAESRKRGSF